MQIRPSMAEIRNVQGFLHKLRDDPVRGLWLNELCSLGVQLPVRGDSAASVDGMIKCFFFTFLLFSGFTFGTSTSAVSIPCGLNDEGIINTYLRFLDQLPEVVDEVLHHIHLVGRDVVERNCTITAASHPLFHRVIDVPTRKKTTLFAVALEFDHLLLVPKIIWHVPCD